MVRIQHLLLLGCAVLVWPSLYAADAVPEPKTQMTERGKLLFADEFNQPLSKEWRSAKGKWEIVEGALKGAELKSDMHGAVTRHFALQGLEQFR